MSNLHTFINYGFTILELARKRTDLSTTLKVKHIQTLYNIMCKYTKDELCLAAAIWCDLYLLFDKCIDLDYYGINPSTDVQKSLKFIDDTVQTDEETEKVKDIIKYYQCDSIPEEYADYCMYLKQSMDIAVYVYGVRRAVEQLIEHNVIYRNVYEISDTVFQEFMTEERDVKLKDIRTHADMILYFVSGLIHTIKGIKSVFYQQASFTVLWYQFIIAKYISGTEGDYVFDVLYNALDEARHKEDK